MSIYLLNYLSILPLPVVYHVDIVVATAYDDAAANSPKSADNPPRAGVEGAVGRLPPPQWQDLSESAEFGRSSGPWPAGSPSGSVPSWRDDREGVTKDWRPAVGGRESAGRPQGVVDPNPGVGEVVVAQLTMM